MKRRGPRYSPSHKKFAIVKCYLCGLTSKKRVIQGITVEVGRAHFETETTRFTILDAPVSYLPSPIFSSL